MRVVIIIKKNEEWLVFEFAFRLLEGRRLTRRSSGLREREVINFVRKKLKLLGMRE
jgi:hypothetical protein